METIAIEIILNSLLFVHIAIRHADCFASSHGRLRLVGFLLVVFGANALLISDRFSTAEALLRALGTSLLFACGSFSMAAHNARRRAKQRKQNEQKAARSQDAAAAETASTPPDPPAPVA